MYHYIMTHSCIIISNQLLNAYLDEYNRNLVSYLTMKNIKTHLVLYRDKPENLPVKKCNIYIYARHSRMVSY